MLENWAVANGEDVTVVFEQPPSPPIRSTVIEVAHAPRPRRDSADDEVTDSRLLQCDEDRVEVALIPHRRAYYAAICSRNVRACDAQSLPPSSSR